MLELNSISAYLTTSTELSGLATKSTLVDGTVFISRERYTIVLKLYDSSGGLAAHVLDRVLITQPIAALHSIITVPAPVVSVGISNGSVDTTLSRNRVRTGREQLGDASGIEASFGQTQSSAKTSASSAYNLEQVRPLKRPETWQNAKTAQTSQVHGKKLEHVNCELVSKY